MRLFSKRDETLNLLSVDETMEDLLKNGLVESCETIYAIYL